jgi:hypothetical protein
MAAWILTHTRFVEVLTQTSLLTNKINPSKQNPIHD